MPVAGGAGGGPAKYPPCSYLDSQGVVPGHRSLDLQGRFSEWFWPATNGTKNRVCFKEADGLTHNLHVDAKQGSALSMQMRGR